MTSRFNVGPDSPADGPSWISHLSSSSSFFLLKMPGLDSLLHRSYDSLLSEAHHQGRQMFGPLQKKIILAHFAMINPVKPPPHKGTIQCTAATSNLPLIGAPSRSWRIRKTWLTRNVQIQSCRRYNTPHGDLFRTLTK